jgi:hypothetical protein
LETVGFKTGIEETFPLCQSEDDVISMVFNWPETQRWRENFLEKEWLLAKEERAFKNYRILQKPQN